MLLNQYDSNRDRYFLFAALVGFVLWLMSISPFRIWATTNGQHGNWIFDVVPSFLAGCTFAFWQAFAVKSRPLASVLYAATLVTVAEVAQLFLPGYIFDVWDVLAGVVGAAVALPVLLWRGHRRRRELSDLDRNKTVELKQKV